MKTTEAFTLYLDKHHNHLSKKTVRDYNADVTTFLRWYERKFLLPITSKPSWVNIQTILELYKKEKLFEFNLSTRSFKRHSSSLRKFFEFLKTEGIISENPLKIKNQSNQARKNDIWYLKKFKNYLLLNNKSNLTIKNYIFDIHRFLTWAKNLAGDDVLSKIDDNLITEYKNSLLKKELSLRSIKRNLSSIQKYLSWISSEQHSKNLDILLPPASPASERPEPSKTEIVLPKISTKQAKTNSPSLKKQSSVIRGINFIFEVLTYSISKIKGKPIFKNIPSVNYEFKIRNLTLETTDKVTDPSSYYPEKKVNLPISVEEPPSNKKIKYNIFRIIQKWYKIYHSYPITNYLHISLLTFFISIFALTAYQNLTAGRVLLLDLSRGAQVEGSARGIMSFDLNVLNQQVVEARNLKDSILVLFRSKIISPITSIDRLDSNIVSPSARRSVFPAIEPTKNSH